MTIFMSPATLQRRRLEREAQELQMVTVLEKPKTYKPSPLSEGELKEYTELAQKAGVYVSQLTMHRFSRFLNEHDIPVFNHDEVVKYMDVKAKEQKDNIGWLWHPLRKKDHMEKGSFGSVSPLYSDYYGSSRCGIYGKPIPLHAIKKVALIEEHFKDEVKMFVSDYAVKNPDPFLMALIEGNRVVHRWVIDVWDEPGFGLIQQLK